MRNYSPAITESAISPRVKEEQVNVTIQTAYIYCIYREDDNDFHMIIGNGKTGSGMHLTCGSDAYKPKTAWEIHSITDIRFLDE